MTLVKDANTSELNEITSSYLEEFQDKETRHIYTDEFLNAKIATQIKALREQRGWTQAELAERAGMKQARIAVLEDVNYSAWTLSILRRLAEAFDLRINLSFEDFGSFLKEFVDFNRESLERTSFADDPVFKKEKKSSRTLEENKKAIKPTTDIYKRTRFTIAAKDSTYANTKKLPEQPELIGLGLVDMSTSNVESTKAPDIRPSANSSYKPYRLFKTA